MQPTVSGRDYRHSSEGETLRELRNAVMDNARWMGFEPRDTDIFVCTPAKCGTTWMQVIAANLIWPDGDIPGPIVTISPWIEAKFGPADSRLARWRITLTSCTITLTHADHEVSSL